MYNDDFDDEDYCGYEEDDNERDLFYTLTVSGSAFIPL